MAITEFSAALNQLASERGIAPETVLEAVKQALAAAYRKDFGGNEDEIKVELDAETGEAKVFEGEKEVTPAGFGRVAAQTAMQVILQRIREEEKSALFNEYSKREGTIISGHIFRVEKGVALVDLGRVQGALPPSEQIRGETYQQGQRIKVLVKEVKMGPRGPEVLVSRADPGFIEGLFTLEVPEITSGVVTIEAITREAGLRTKMAVSSTEERVDPVGSCVGQKGVRVQSITREVGEEKIDIVPYFEDPAKFVAVALSPAKVLKVDIDQKAHKATVDVPEDQLSLAIGKDGQNVRLAAKLTGWKIDIKGAADLFAKETEEIELKGLGLPTRVVNALISAGITSSDALKGKSDEELLEIKGLGKKAVDEIREKIE